MKAVFLENFFFFDIDLSPLKEVLTELKVYDETEKSQIVERCRDAEIVLINKSPFDKDILKELKHIKYIQVLATGVDCVDIEYAKQRGIEVKNVTDYSSSSVTMYILTCICNLFTSAPTYIDEVKKGKWENTSRFCILDHPIEILKGKKIGIIGYGSIGKSVAKVAETLEMEVLPAKGRQDNYPEKRYTLSEILSSADVIVLTLPLTKDNEHMMSKKEFAAMKPSAYFINASRGALVNEQDLADALDSGTIAGAATDVLSVEPPKGTNPLLNCSHKKLYITPHIAWAAKSARISLLDKVIGNAKEYLDHINR